ncbi:hypothetical protein Goklo_029466 [Gossypium klotzschianum]|uniref:Uncharacterized protein n=1 Tax=Gossypium klotzschianum TaxID=34286 RepID=A0A7J8WF65_9ROSI|nr:hypothetical protein [Gossypium klotzschianum]
MKKETIFMDAKLIFRFIT